MISVTRSLSPAGRSWSVLFAHAAGAAGAYLFIKGATGWSHSTDLAGSDTSTDDAFGYSVAVSGTTIAVGAYGHDSGVGRVYVFEG